MYLQEIKQATPQANGQSDLRHLFAYRPDHFGKLLSFTEYVMRGPGALPQGDRELLAALTSKRNDCDY